MFSGRALFRQSLKLKVDEEFNKDESFAVVRRHLASFGRIDTSYAGAITDHIVNPARQSASCECSWTNEPVARPLQLYLWAFFETILHIVSHAALSIYVEHA
jgi:hypothetical protein